MSTHITASRLVDYTDRRLPDPERVEVEKHLGACLRCRTEVSSLRQLDRHIRPHVPGGDLEDSADATSWNLEVPSSLAAALENRARRLLDAGVPAAAGARSMMTARRWWLVAALGSAAAVLAIVWPGAGPGAVTGLESRVVFADGPDGLRAAGDPSFHFVVNPGTTGWLCILEASGSGVAPLFPHQNPVFGDFGLTGPFAAGAEVRIPPDPILDYPAAPADRSGVFAVIPLAEAPTTPVRDALAAGLAEALGGIAPAGRLVAVQAWATAKHPEARVFGGQ